MRKLYPLTDQEREFAEANISLVDKFLSCKGFHPDDYYDIAVFGYLEAIQALFRKPCEPERSGFKALAFICMRHAIGEEWKKKRFKKRCAQVVSLDYAVNPTNGNEYSLNDYIPDTTQNVELQVENQDLIERTLNAATPREREVISLIHKGFNNSEIAKVIGVTANTAQNFLRDFRKKARDIRDEIPITYCPQYEHRKKYFLAHPEAYEKHKAYRREYHKANIDKANACKRKYREANRDKINAYQREYRKANRDKLNAYNREYNAANREKVNAYTRAWRAKQKEKALLELQPQQGIQENLSVAL